MKLPDIYITPLEWVLAGVLLVAILVAFLL